VARRGGAARPRRRRGLRGPSPAGPGRQGRLSGQHAPRRQPGAVRAAPHPRHHLPRRGVMLDLFDRSDERPGTVSLSAGAVLLRGFCLEDEAGILAAIRRVEAAAPFRQMVTPGGYTMSVAMTNCGAAGWVSDRAGYRYEPRDPANGKPWPPMPAVFRDLATRAAAAAGYPGFVPDACLVNRYVPGTKLSLHQDR